MKMMPNHFRILCEVEWPSVGVGWPPEDTMNLKIVEADYTVVTGEPSLAASPTPHSPEKNGSKKSFPSQAENWEMSCLVCLH